MRSPVAQRLKLMILWTVEITAVNSRPLNLTWLYWELSNVVNCHKTSTSGRTEKNRQYTRMGYYYHIQRLCMRTFLFLHCLHRNRFYSLVKHHKNGLSLQVHWNKNRLPSSTSSAETVEQVVKFILNTAEEQAFLLPGRVPGFKRIDVKLLSSHLTKHGLWRTYTNICVGTGKPSMEYSKFCNLWNQLCPFIVIMWPATDLCWTCQKNNNRIRNTVDLPESDKAEAVRAQEQYLLLATGERNFYNCCRESKDGIQEYLKVVDFAVEREPYSYDGTVHYSYDHAQQLHFTADPNQPGWIYFKTPWKCALFGVCCEAIPRQSKLPRRWKCTTQQRCKQHHFLCTLIFSLPRTWRNQSSDARR